MGILNDLGKLIEREDDEDVEGGEEESGDESDDTSAKEIADKSSEEDDEDEKASGSEVGDILKHIESVKAAAEFIDTLTTDQPDTTAFEAEISLRKALSKMQDLSDESYKNKKSEDKEI